MSNPKDTRKCIACREHSDKSEMLRFVKQNGGGVFLDESKKADGRGVWVHNCEDCIQKLIRKKTLNAVFKRNVGDEIYGEINE